MLANISVPEHMDTNRGEVNMECSQLDQPSLRTLCIKLTTDIRLCLFLYSFLTLNSFIL